MRSASSPRRSAARRAPRLRRRVHAVGGAERLIRRRVRRSRRRSGHAGRADRAAAGEVAAAKPGRQCSRGDAAMNSLVPRCARMPPSTCRRTWCRRPSSCRAPAGRAERQARRRRAAAARRGLGRRAACAAIAARARYVRSVRRRLGCRRSASRTTSSRSAGTRCSPRDWQSGSAPSRRRPRAARCLRGTDARRAGAPLGRRVAAAPPLEAVDRPARVPPRSRSAACG